MVASVRERVSVVVVVVLPAPERRVV